MFNTRKAMAAGAVALALAGATVSTGQAAASDRRQLPQNVQFYNEAVDGNLDGNGSGPLPITFPPNGGLYQAWTLSPTPVGFQIQNVFKGTCLQAPPIAGNPVLLAPCNFSDPSQWWNLNHSNNGVVITEVLDPGSAIQTTGIGTPVVKAIADGSPLQQWDVLPA